MCKYIIYFILLLVNEHHPDQLSDRTLNTFQIIIVKKKKYNTEQLILTFLKSVIDLF